MLYLIDNEYGYKVGIEDAAIKKISIESVNLFKEYWTEEELSKSPRYLIDNQTNGIEINLRNKKICLDYLEQEELYILLKIWKNKFEPGPESKYKLVEVTQVGEL